VHQNLARPSQIAEKQTVNLNVGVTFLYINFRVIVRLNYI
jgi:hypothetical protein